MGYLVRRVRGWARWAERQTAGYPTDVTAKRVELERVTFRAATDPEEFMSKTRSLAIVTLAYVVAVGVAAAWLGWGPSTDLLLDTFIADLLATIVIFVFS